MNRILTDRLSRKYLASRRVMRKYPMYEVDTRYRIPIRLTTAEDAFDEILRQLKITLDYKERNP